MKFKLITISRVDDLDNIFRIIYPFLYETLVDDDKHIFVMSDAGVWCRSDQFIESFRLPDEFEIEFIPRSEEFVEISDNISNLQNIDKFL